MCQVRLVGGIRFALFNILLAVFCLSGQFADAANLSGNWSSNLGSVSFRQAGGQVSGTLRYPNGATAAINGTMQGNRLNFRFSILPTIGGTGFLTLSNDGKRLTGRYTGTGGKSGPFNLTRSSTVTRPPVGTVPSNTRPRNEVPKVTAAEILRLLFPPETASRPRVGTQPRTNTNTPAAVKPATRIAPTTRQLAQLTTSDLQRVVELYHSELAPPLAELDRSLERLDYTAGWKKHLHTNQLASIVSSSTKTPDRDSTEMLKKILATYDDVDRDPKYQKIAKQPGFTTTHQRLGELVNASLVLAIRNAQGRSAQQRADVTAKLEALIKAMKKEQAQEQLQTKVLRKIVSMKPGRVNPSQAAVLQEIKRRFDAANKNAEADDVVQLKEFGDAKEMVTQYLAHVRQATRYRASFGTQLLMPGTNKWKSTASSSDPSGIVKLGVPDEVEVMPLSSVEVMPLDSEPVEAVLLPFEDDLPEEEPEYVLAQFSDVTEANKKQVSTWTTASVSADLNRWAGSKFVFMPRIDRVAPESAEGHEAGATLTLVGRFFSTEREQNTIQLMKRLADGSIGVLAEVKPSVASTAGTALEFDLPDDLKPTPLIVRVVVEENGDQLTSNPYELNAKTPLSAAPVITKINPASEAPSKPITIDGSNFGDAALVELWFHPKAEQPLPTVAKEGSTTLAEVRSDQQLVTLVPIGLTPGDYLVACNRNGRLSNWVEFKVQ